MLAKLLPPSSGPARIAGYNIVTQASEGRRHIGYVPQLLSADGSLSGYASSPCPPARTAFLAPSAR